jgi:hypothetical protein
LALITNGFYSLRVGYPPQGFRTKQLWLRHLLRGDFTIDIDAIGIEALNRNDETNTLGVMPALLRLPLPSVCRLRSDRRSGMVVLYCGLSGYFIKGVRSAHG